MRGQGPSAQGTEGEEVVIVKGARERRYAVKRTWREKKKTVVRPGIVWQCQRSHGGIYEVS